MKHEGNLFYREYDKDLNSYEANRDYEVVFGKNLDLLMIPEEPAEEIYYKAGGLYQIRAKEMSGYADETGKIVIPCIYEHGYAFSESGLAFVVTRDGKKGYINKGNEMVISLPEDIEQGGVFEQGLAYITDGKTYMFINEDGNRVFGEDFLFTEGFAENGIAIVEDKEHIFKAIDTNGDTVFKLPIFVSAEGFYKNPEITVIKHGKSKGVVDRNGNIIFGCDFDEIKLSSYNDVHMAEYRGRWALIRNDGKRLTDYIFINPTYVNKQGYFVAKLEGKSIDNLYIFKADDSGYAAIDVIKNIDNYEISEDQPLITLTNCYGHYYVRDMETGEDIDKSISGFLSRYVRGEAIGYLSGREIVKMLEIKKKIAKDKEVSVELERRYGEITKEKILGEVTYKLAGRDFDINNQHNLVLKSFLDMKVFYKLLMARENGKTVGIILSKELIKDKGISFEELDKAAYENTKANEMKFEFLEENQGIITSETGVDGAAALLYGDFLEEVAEKYGSDFYIIPSSTHKLFAVHKDAINCDIDELSENLAEANRDKRKDDEVLSFNIYRYDKKTKQLLIAEKIC